MAMPDQIDLFSTGQDSMNPQDGVIADISSLLDMMVLGVIPRRYADRFLINNSLQDFGIPAERVVLVLSEGSPKDLACDIPFIDVDHIAVRSDEEVDLIRDKLCLYSYCLPDYLSQKLVSRPDLASGEKIDDIDLNPPLFDHDKSSAAKDATQVVWFLEDFDNSEMAFLQSNSFQSLSDAAYQLLSNIAFGCERSLWAIFNLMTDLDSWGEAFVTPGEKAAYVARVLREEGEVPEPLIASWESYVTDIVLGEISAAPGGLLDHVTPDQDPGPRLLLRALSGLFRCSTFELGQVNAFIESHEGQVGNQVRKLMLGMSSWASGGFGSASLNKSQADLYKIGSCISAGQTSRISVHYGNADFPATIYIDGRPLELLDKLESGRTEDRTRLEKIREFASQVGFQIAYEDLHRRIIEIGTGRNNSKLFVEFDSEDVQSSCPLRIQFTWEIDLPKNKKRVWPKEFTEACCEFDGRSVIVARKDSFPSLKLKRDQLLDTCDVAEFLDHAKALSHDADSIESKWNELTGGIQ